jgi:hypothetical protein
VTVTRPNGLDDELDQPVSPLDQLIDRLERLAGQLVRLERDVRQLREITAGLEDRSGW